MTYVPITAPAILIISIPKSALRKNEYSNNSAICRKVDYIVIRYNYSADTDLRASATIISNSSLIGDGNCMPRS